MMGASKMPAASSIALSGAAYPIDERFYRKPKTGDISFYGCLSARGRRAVSGRHTNEGYEGSYRASVYDGHKWRRLSLIDLVPWDSCRYSYQYEKDAARKHIVADVAKLAGTAVGWDKTKKRYQAIQEAVEA